MFITIEGIDGSGKTTVCDALNELGDVVVTAEPSTMWTGDHVRKAIADNSSVGPLATTFLFLADRAHHVDRVIQPLLTVPAILGLEEHTVICDRYHDSTVAYQTVALKEVAPNARDVLERCRGWFPEPDLTILLDAPTDVALERAGRDDEVFEKQEFLTAVREQYLIMAEREERIVTVDAWRPEADVLDDVRGIVTEAIEGDGS